MALWLNANVPGIRVPNELLTETHAAVGGDGEEQSGIAIAARTIQAIKPLCAGVHIMAMGWEKHIPEMLRASGLR
jgi:5,10-methylenetetrahydrofolate reductase